MLNTTPPILGGVVFSCAHFSLVITETLRYDFRQEYLIFFFISNRLSFLLSPEDTRHMQKSLRNYLVIYLLMVAGIFSFLATAVHAQSEEDVDFNTINAVDVDLKVDGNDGLVTVEKKTKVLVSWTSEGAKSCRANWRSGKLPLSGSQKGTINKSLVFTVTCIGKDSSEKATDSVAVQVSGEEKPISNREITKTKAELQKVFNTYRDELVAKVDDAISEMRQTIQRSNIRKDFERRIVEMVSEFRSRVNALEADLQQAFSSPEFLRGDVKFINLLRSEIPNEFEALKETTARTLNEIAQEINRLQEDGSPQSGEAISLAVYENSQTTESSVSVTDQHGNPVVLDTTMFPRVPVGTYKVKASVGSERGTFLAEVSSSAIKLFDLNQNKKLVAEFAISGPTIRMTFFDGGDPDIVTIELWQGSVNIPPRSEKGFGPYYQVAESSYTLRIQDINSSSAEQVKISVKPKRFEVHQLSSIQVPSPTSASSSPELIPFPSGITLSAQINGSSTPEALKGNSDATLTWSSKNAKYCATKGSFSIVYTDGKNLNDETNLPPSGSKTFVVPNSVKSADIFVECYGSTQTYSLNKFLTFKIVPNQSPSISQITGPAIVDVNKSQTWELWFSNPDGDLLEATVVHGDGNPTGATKDKQTTSANTGVLGFSYEFPTPGTKILIFTLNDGRGGAMTKSFALTVAPTTVASTQPSITVLSPNGGESYVSGDSTIYIKYQSTNLIGSHVAAYLDSPTLGKIRSTANNSASNSGVIEMSLSKAGADPIGQYKITLCSDVPSNGKDLCDSSDNYFTITAPTVSTPPPVPNQNPTLSLLVNGSEVSEITVSRNATVALSWTSSGATTCTPTGGNIGWSPASKGTVGNFTSSAITDTTSFNLSCNNAAGNSASKTVVVKVGAETPPPTTVAPTSAVAYPSFVTTDRQKAIADLYRTLFKREPDQGGLQYWDSTGASLDAIRTTFMSTPEYRALHPTSMVPRSVQLANLFQAMFGLMAE